MAPRLHAYPFTPADARATAFDRPACRLAVGPRRTARGRHGLSVALLVAVTLTGTMLPATAAARTGATSASATTLHDTVVFTEFHENADSMPSTPSAPAWSLTASASGWRNGVGFGIAVSRFNRLDPVVCWWRDCPPSGPRNGPVVRAGGGLPARASPHAPPQPLLPIRPATDVTQLPPPWRSSRIATAPRLPLPWGAASSGLSVCRRVLPQSAAGGHPRVEAEHLAPQR